MDFGAVSETLSAYSALGFDVLEPVYSLRTIAHLFGPRKSRCGIYLLLFSNGNAYIGQAVEVVRRFVQHRQKYDDIIGFSFQHVRRSRLDVVEKELIQQAECLGLVLLNSVHVSHVVGDSDLDAVISSEIQKAWIAAPVQFNLADITSRRLALPNQLARFERRFARFKQLPMYASVVGLLCVYLSSAVPAPRSTEYTFWAVSCLPGTGSYKWPRFTCVSVGVMEVFVVGYFSDQSDEVWGFVNVASDVLWDRFGSEQAVQSAFPDVEILACNYRDAGQYQVRLQTNGLRALNDLLSHSAVQAAAAALVLRVMRKRATIYGKYHCWQLADAVFEQMSRACRATPLPSSRGLGQPEVGG